MARRQHTLGPWRRRRPLGAGDASTSLNEGDRALQELRAYGLSYPGAHTKSPWPGHLDLAVDDKTFAYLSIEGEPFQISCKLPHSSEVALLLPFCTPTAYGLGKSGWVTAQLTPDKSVPVELFEEWIDESYRAQAPKKLVAQLEQSGAPTDSLKKREAVVRSTARTPTGSVKKGASVATRTARTPTGSVKKGASVATRPARAPTGSVKKGVAVAKRTARTQATGRVQPRVS